MGKVKNREFWESAAMNNYTFRQYYNRLVELSVAMFEWKNLPKTVDPRYLELVLFALGQAVFFKDEEMGFLCLKNGGSGMFDVYNVPKVRRAIANNGYQMGLDDTNSVIIYNNFLRTPSMLDVEMFSKRLYNIDRTIDVNINAQKTPILIKCDENQRLSLLNVYKEFDGNAPVIFGNKALNVDDISVLSTGAPFVAKDLIEVKNQVWNEALTYLGISNVNYQKRERMITDEVTRSQGGTVANRYSRLQARRQACDKINDMFGLDIWVDYREDYQLVSDEEDTVQEEPNSEGKGGTTDKEGEE